MATASAKDENKAVESTGIKVLIAIDSNVRSKDVINFYMNLLHRSTNEIILLHVVELPDLFYAGTGNVTATIMSEKWIEECLKGQKMLDQCIELLNAKGVFRVRSRLDNGLKPGQVIVEVTKEEGAKLVIVGTRGLGLLKRTVMGSVSDYVMSHVNCPIAIYRHHAESKH